MSLLRKVFLVNMNSNKIIVLCLVAMCSSDEESNNEVFDTPEGSNCTSKGLDGKCTTILNCRSAKDGLRRKVYPLICSFQGKTPIICCTDCELQYSTTTPITDLQLDSRFNQTENKARYHCLKYLEYLPYPCSYAPRVMLKKRRHTEKNCYNYMEPPALEDPNRKNTLDDRSSFVPPHSSQPIPPVSAGSDATRDQYPHMALLGYGYLMEIAQWLCGGSIINEKYILTAAHCISSPTVGPVRYVALGILKRSDPPGFWQKYNVKRIIAHPEYQPPSKYNDIALLETEETIIFGYRVLPGCLPLVPESDETAEATGWGALGNHQELADTLQTFTLQPTYLCKRENTDLKLMYQAVAKVPYNWIPTGFSFKNGTVQLHRYDEEECSQLYPKHRHLREGYNHTSQMCYGDTVEAKDTCEGDSGGPLQTPNVFLHCAYTVLGVTSYGRQCGISAGSGMYTRVYHYVPWIESIVWA